MDARLRELERRARATGDPNDIARWLLEANRGGNDGVEGTRSLLIHAAGRAFSAARWRDRLNNLATAAVQAEYEGNQRRSTSRPTALGTYVEWVRAKATTIASYRVLVLIRIFDVHVACRARAGLPVDPQIIWAETSGAATTKPGWVQKAVAWAFGDPLRVRARRPRRRTPANGDPITVLSRARDRGVMLSTGQLMWAGRRAATAYRAQHGRDPGRTPETAPNGETHDVFCYGAADVALVDAAIDAEERGDPRTGLGGGRRRSGNAPCRHNIPVGQYCYPCGGMVGSMRAEQGRART